MNGLDFVVIGILLFSLLLGVWRGLIYEVMALLGWPLAFVLCKLFAGHLAPLLPLQQETWRNAAAGGSDVVISTSLRSQNSEVNPIGTSFLSYAGDSHG